jgi:hypothetical protein
VLPELLVEEAELLVEAAVLLVDEVVLLLVEEVVLLLVEEVVLPLVEEVVPPLVLALVLPVVPVAPPAPPMPVPLLLVVPVALVPPAPPFPPAPPSCASMHIPAVQTCPVSQFSTVTQAIWNGLQSAVTSGVRRATIGMAKRVRAFMSEAPPQTAHHATGEGASGGRDGWHRLQEFRHLHHPPYGADGAPERGEPRDGKERVRHDLAHPRLDDEVVGLAGGGMVGWDLELVDGLATELVRDGAAGRRDGRQDVRGDR